MLIQPYQTDELNFAWCYRVFFRWRTWRRVPVPSLASLTAESLNTRLEQYQVRLLEFGSDTLDIRALVSLQPQESTATAASKTKGQLCGSSAETVSGFRDPQSILAVKSMKNTRLSDCKNQGSLSDRK
ncbi:MAG: hypothetical protein SGI77_02825, partial [Pirellulaceae bacterium]|nr:hypothetical protein [Pirellulaceae bacterium]